MKWLELHIDTTHAGLDTVVALLSALDIDGVVAAIREIVGKKIPL